MKQVQRVAVIHDWLTGMRGGEVVLEAILELFPEAELFTLLHNRGSVSPFIENRKIHTSFVDSLPFKKSRYRHYLPLFPTAVERFDFHGFDLVISSSHCVAKGVVVPPGIPHISFIHSPMRYVWDMYGDYFPPTGFLNRFVVPFFANYLRIWDAASAPRVDRYVCNSRFVAQRVSRYYGKSAAVVHPPSVQASIKPEIPETREEFYLVMSALVPYKRIDLAVEAFRDFGRELLVVGGGPEEKRLRSMASSSVRFLGHLPDNDVADLMRKAKALIFPGLEDFGIVPVEAQTRGCPVVAYGAGGALETIVEGKTGVFFQEQTVESLREAVLRSETIRYKPADFKKNVARFTDEAFKRGFMAEIRKCVELLGYRLS